MLVYMKKNKINQVEYIRQQIYIQTISCHLLTDRSPPSHISLSVWWSSHCELE